MLVIKLIIPFFFSTSAMAWWSWTPGDHVDDSTQNGVVKGYHPEQPIPFNHKLHVQDRQISCNYCHSSARRSITGGIPSSATCMGCHKIVKADSEPIKYLTEKFEKNEPIEWVKVHDLPDYVRFSHRIHVNAKNDDGEAMLVCQDCHGPVETMGTAEQWAPLQMGWCIDCHNKEKKPAVSGKPAVTNAPVSCNTCHY